MAVGFESANFASGSISDIRVALVMPVYNEGITILSTVSDITTEVLHKIPRSFLFIFEDGSKDNTKQVLTTFSSSESRVCVNMTENRKGYPKAVKDAIASVDESLFDYVAFADSDGQYNPQSLVRLIELVVKQPMDIVIGRRTNRAEPFYRTVLSRGLNFLEKTMFHPSCNDVTSALRIMRVTVAKKIASEVRYSPYNFWLEFTARAAKEGYNMVEIPIEYRPRAGQTESNVYSLTKMPKIVWKEFSALLKVWWEYNLGRSRAQFIPEAKTS